MTCIICDRRPAVEDGYCANCLAKVNKLKRSSKANEPFRYLTYRGIVVGLYPNGDGALKPRLLRRKPDYLPKSKTLDLNTYLVGFDRSQIKRMKAACLKLASI